MEEHMDLQSLLNKYLCKEATQLETAAICTTDVICTEYAGMRHPALINYWDIENVFNISLLANGKIKMTSDSLRYESRFGNLVLTAKYAPLVVANCLLEIFVKQWKGTLQLPSSCSQFIFNTPKASAAS
jgi:hypothetical protein